MNPLRSLLCLFAFAAGGKTVSGYADKRSEMAARNWMKQAGAKDLTPNPDYNASGPLLNLGRQGCPTRHFQPIRWKLWLPS